MKMSNEKKQYKYCIRMPVWKLYYVDRSIIAPDDPDELLKKYQSGDFCEWNNSSCVKEHEDKPYIISKEEL